MAEITLESLQEEISKLRDEMEELKAKGVKPDRGGRGVEDQLAGDVKKMLDDSDKPSGGGVCLATALMGPRGTGTSVSWHKFDDLDWVSPEGVHGLVTFFSDLLVVKALYILLEQHFTDESRMQLSKEEMMTRLSISEEELETVMKKLIDREYVKWGRTAEGDEYFELANSRLFTLLLGLGQLFVRYR